MKSVVTDQGTAMQEATLCEDCYRVPLYRIFAEDMAGFADDCPNPRDWHDSTGNDAVACVECGLRA